MAVSLATALSSTMISCSDDDDPVTPEDQTIEAIVNTNANFSLLKAAVTKAGIGSALAGGTLTVFAPDNDAFAASGITNDVINSLSSAELINILTYHVVTSRISSGAVPASDTVKTLQTRNLYASKNANGVFVNGSKVKTADIGASNGVIHVISNVLMPPTKTIAQLASETPDLSRLLTAVTRAGLAGAVSGPGNFTVFAPTNAAFTAAGFATDADINAAPEAAVNDIVSAHVLGTNVFASDLVAGGTANTIKAGTSLTIGTTPPSVKITGSANPASNIIIPAGVNIIATNGVVHLIDRVLQ